MNKLNHVAFIMDGNGRWGRKEIKVEILTFKGCRNSKKNSYLLFKIKNSFITFYVFSSENWNRPKRNILFI